MKNNLKSEQSEERAKDCNLKSELVQFSRPNCAQILLCFECINSGCPKFGSSKTGLVRNPYAILPIGCLRKCQKTGHTLQQPTSFYIDIKF